MVSMIVATGTSTLYIVADRIHPIGSRGISNTSLHQRIRYTACQVALISYLGLTNIARVETPIAIGYIAIA
eukprot:5304450-Pleurochrysis_carterae.AAC.1